jgi:toxin FitB
MGRHASASHAITRESSAGRRPISQFDAMIAAVTKSRGATLATRNVKDFVNCGVAIVDPWAR